MNNWISVKTTIPHNEDLFLAYNGEWIDIHLFKGGSFYTFEHDDWEIDNSITHWMPLPNPPSL